MDAPRIHCVIRNIPTSDSGHAAANACRYPGIETRKRGRGPRARPHGYTDYRGYRQYAGGEYQDLPVDSAPRFSMYFRTRNWNCAWSYDCLYFDFVGIAGDGRLRVRPISSDAYHRVKAQSITHNILQFRKQETGT